LAAFAEGFDDADVFVDGAAGGADFDGPGIHDWLRGSRWEDVRRRTAVIIMTVRGEIKGNHPGISLNVRCELSLRLSRREEAGPAEKAETQGVFARRDVGLWRFHPKHGLALGRQLVAAEPARAAALHLRGVGAPKSRRRVRAHPGLQELSPQVRRVLEVVRRSNRLHPDWNR